MYHISNDKRSKESALWIFEALERLMRLKPYESITITDICKEAKIGRVTFYRHYDTMEDVLRKRCDDKFNGLVEYFREFYTSNPKSEPFIKPFLRYWYVHSSIIELIIKADKTPIINDCFERMFSLLNKHVVEMPKTIIQHKNYFIAIRVSLAIAILLEWVKDDKSLAPDDLASIIIDQVRESLNLSLLL